MAQCPPLLHLGATRSFATPFPPGFLPHPEKDQWTLCAPGHRIGNRLHSRRFSAGARTRPYLYPGPTYDNTFPEDYSSLYGEDRPFAPSLALTSTGGAFDPDSLAGSETCGSANCHSQILAEWKPSAHRYSAMDPLFQKVQNLMAEQNGPESTRYCGGCHDPISLFSGTKNIFAEDLTALQGYNEGVSCLSCHGIRETDLQGNANYVITQPARYLWQWKQEGAGKFLSDFLIRTYPDKHNELSKRMFKAPEYCAACHKQWGVLRAMSASGPADLADAATALERAHEINQEETGSLLALGEIAILQGQTEIARQRLEWACNTNPRAVGGFFLRAYLAHRDGDRTTSTRLLRAAQSARGPEWKPRGAVAEGDVRQRMRVETSPLSRFWQSWDGLADPTVAFEPLESFLGDLPNG